jgi:hypothetical protein
LEGFILDEDLIDVKIAMDEMRLNIQQSLDAGDAIDRKLNQTIIASGAIISVISTLQLTLNWEKSSCYWTIFYIVLGLYILNVILALLFSGPSSYKLPISPEWDVFENKIFNKPKREIYLTLLSGYVDQIENNRQINKQKTYVYYFCSATIPLAVILLFLLVIIN